MNNHDMTANPVTKLTGFLPHGFYQGNPMKPADFVKLGELNVYAHQRADEFLMMRVGLESPYRPHRYADFFSTDRARTFYELKPFLIERRESVNGKPPVHCGGYYVNSNGELSDDRRVALEGYADDLLVGAAFVPVRDGEEINLGLFNRLDQGRASLVFESAQVMYALPNAMTDAYIKEEKALQLLSSASEPVAAAMRAFMDKGAEGLNKFKHIDFASQAALLAEAADLFAELGDEGRQLYSLHCQGMALALCNDPRWKSVANTAALLRQALGMRPFPG